MELIKELPAIFEDFAEARRNSFLTVKEAKDKGIPVVGAYCTYFPKEIAMAMGAATVGLCSTSDETIGEAEKVLPRNLCPLIKSSYGFAKTDKCPYFYFSDVVVGETTCDGKKKMYEYMNEFKEVFLMELPQSQRPETLALWKSEIIRFKEYLEAKFDTKITDEDIRKAVRLENDVRKAISRLFECMKQVPAPISGLEFFQVLNGTQFKLDRSVIPAEIDNLIEKIKTEPKEETKEGPRIIITGCPMGPTTEKVIKAVEEHGGIVVGYENCTGAKQYVNLIDEEADDIIEAIAERYLNIGCSVMTPNNNRRELLGSMIEEYKADGVIDLTLTACHTYNVESRSLEADVKEKYDNIPFLQIETDYSQSDIGQINVRVQGFLEVI